MSAAVHEHPTPHRSAENPHAGQGWVLLDIGDDIGAAVVTMPEAWVGTEVEARPVGRHLHHLPHVEVLPRPTARGWVASLVFGELEQGTWELFEKGTGDVRLVVDVVGGEVRQAVWTDERPPLTASA